MAASKEILQRIRQAPAQAVGAIKKANRTLDAFEDGFGKRSTGDKIKLVFVIGATATVIPGGYIALQIWGIRKLGKWAIKKFDCRSRADDASKSSGSDHRPPGMS